MKIYVDELPKSCLKCPLKYFKFNEWDCEFDDYCVYTKDRVNDCDTNRSNICPLQSLADHDKRLIEDFTNIIDDKFNVLGYVEEKFEDIKKYVLDQIQGETK